MIKIGQFNNLKVIKEVPFGVYLDGAEWDDILLPKKVVPEGTQIGDTLKVFLYFDSEDKLIATTREPRAVLGSCAYMKVIDVNRVGAFLDWGLDKDLLVPIPEQLRRMELEKSYLVYLKQDNQGRLIASSKLDHFLDKSPNDLKSGEEVELLIAACTDLGTKVIVNNKYWGLIHASDIFEPLQYGKKTRGFVKAVREDGKLDVVLRKLGRDSIHKLAEIILKELEKQGGFLAVHDKSSPEEIQRMFHESKKSFKSALGQLYKRGEIIIKPDGIHKVKK